MIKNRNAIILAAGMGSRLKPSTHTTPKPLTQIGGIPIIERQIEFLKEKGIDDIIVVIGYMHEQFYYLEHKYDIRLIYNNAYEKYNNIYSLYLCREYFKNTWVLEGDVFLYKNFIPSHIDHSTYLCATKRIHQPEWELKFSNDYDLQSIIIHGISNHPIDEARWGHTMSGISYWDQSSSEILLHDLKERISRLFKGEEVISIGNQYWDQLVVDNLDKLNIKVELIELDACIEIDNEIDLFDANTLHQINNKNTIEQ